MPRSEEDGEAIKRMVNLLREGSTLTDLACPVCASPLFRLKHGTLWCAKDQKKVIVVKEGEERTQTRSMALQGLEDTLMTKIDEIQRKMQKEQDPEKLQALGNTLSSLLENLEKTKTMKNR